MVDNSVNTYICYNNWIFIWKIEPIITTGVGKIGGKYLHPQGICMVWLSCMDDKGQFHTNNLIFFFFSLISSDILSTTVLYESMKDSKGTWVLTKKSTLYSHDILGIIQRQFHTQKNFFQNYKSNPFLAIFRVLKEGEINYKGLNNQFFLHTHQKKGLSDNCKSNGYHSRGRKRSY